MHYVGLKTQQVSKIIEGSRHGKARRLSARARDIAVGDAHDLTTPIAGCCAQVMARDGPASDDTDLHDDLILRA
jgi:hypothetical protein